VYLPYNPTAASAYVASGCVIPITEGTVTISTGLLVEVGVARELDADDESAGFGDPMVACPDCAPQATMNVPAIATPMVPTIERFMSSSPGSAMTEPDPPVVM
jgi:hypothetical protein